MGGTSFVCGFAPPFIRVWCTLVAGGMIIQNKQLRTFYFQQVRVLIPSADVRVDSGSAGATSSPSRKQGCPRSLATSAGQRPTGDAAISAGNEEVRLIPTATTMDENLGVRVQIPELYTVHPPRVSRLFQVCGSPGQSPITVGGGTNVLNVTADPKHQYTCRLHRSGKRSSQAQFWKPNRHLFVLYAMFAVVR